MQKMLALLYKYVFTEMTANTLDFFFFYLLEWTLL